MRKTVILWILLIGSLLSACGGSGQPMSSTEPSETCAVTVPTEPPVLPPEPDSTVPPAEPETSLPSPEPVVVLTEKEKTILLKLGMAERGDTGCTECIALVMRTVLNRVASGHYGKNVRSVVFAENQFSPVAEGSYYNAQPNEQCYEALEMVIYGWDESQGALFYEWCEGECWHSRNRHLLFQHCDTRFYN